MAENSFADRARSLTAIVDFGDDPSGDATVTVSGNFQWLNKLSVLIPHIRGRVDTEHVDDEDPIVEGLRAQCHNIVEGESFDVTVHAPELTTGTYLVHIVGA